MDVVDDVHVAAREAYAAGLCIIPTAEDGSKRPIGNRAKWKHFQTRRPTPDELRSWYPGRAGIGVIAGEVSGRVECWDFDDRAIYDAFVVAAREGGLGELLNHIEAGYRDDTPGDGVRWLVRYPEGIERTGQIILARREKRREEMNHESDKVKALIELPLHAILAPSNGKVHPSGKPYVHRSGAFSTIASYTADERDALMALAGSFDQMNDSVVVRDPAAERGSEGTKPGEVWAARTSWSEVLEPHGWTKAFTHGDVTYWRRPGKHHDWSATTNHGGGDTLKVFSTSTPFESVLATKKSYDKFGAWTVLEHRGDFTAAARALVALGYGESQNGRREKASRPAYTGPECSLNAVLETFRVWLHLPDETPVFAVLGAVAANRLDGDPVWLGIVAPPSSAKTEMLNALGLLPDIYPTATLTPAALLSGTPKKQRSKAARGGLLREIGEFGIMLMKDFGSVLSMRPDAKAEVLAALREVYDGSWTRHLGSEGGTTYSWAGKVGLVFGVTPAIDSHHSVIGAMGERFCLVRMDAAGAPQLARALNHIGKGTSTMRRELAEAVAGLFAGERREPRPLDDDERDQLISMATTAVRIRSTVERDRRSMEIESIHGAEGPARLGLALERMLAGLDTIGCDRGIAMNVICRIARDSVPPLRRWALDYLLGHDEPLETKVIAEARGLPTVTMRRVLEDLAAYQLVLRIGGGQGKADRWIANPEPIG